MTTERDDEDHPVTLRTAILWSVASLGALVGLWTITLMYLPGGW